MRESTRCEIDGCGGFPALLCARCGRALCRQHAIAAYQHLPGGQRPYCPECDAERRSLYEAVKPQGARAVAVSLAGAVLGAIGGYLASVAFTPDSFVHSIVTDVGFLAGLALALRWALSTGRPRAR